jgi:predicted TIM-barrel fold metal-dependent hydrolase
VRSRESWGDSRYEWIGRALALAFVLGGCASATGSAPPTAPRVDYHQHLVSARFAPIVKFPEMDGRELVARMDAAGIERAVVLSVGYSFADERKNLPDPAGLTRQENDWTSQQVSASRGRLIGFCSANPLRPDALAEIERCLKLPGMRGVKLHFGNGGVSLRHPEHAARIGEFFTVAERAKVPVLVHMRARGGQNYGATDAQIFLDQVMPKAPGIEVVVAHLGASGPGYTAQHEEVMAVFTAAIARKDPRTRRLYFDMSGILTAESTADEAARMAATIRQVGVSRVLYGTDTLRPEGPPLSGHWALVTTKLGLSEPELRTLADNRARFAR